MPVGSHGSLRPYKFSAETRNWYSFAGVRFSTRRWVNLCVRQVYIWANLQSLHWNGKSATCVLKDCPLPWSAQSYPAAHGQLQFFHNVLCDEASTIISWWFPWQQTWVMADVFSLKIPWWIRNIWVMPQIKKWVKFNLNMKQKVTEYWGPVCLSIANYDGPCISSPGECCPNNWCIYQVLDTGSRIGHHHCFMVDGDMPTLLFSAIW